MGTFGRLNRTLDEDISATWKGPFQPTPLSPSPDYLAPIMKLWDGHGTSYTTKPGSYRPQTLNSCRVSLWFWNSEWVKGSKLIWLRDQSLMLLQGLAPVSWLITRSLHAFAQQRSALGIRFPLLLILNINQVVNRDDKQQLVHRPYFFRYEKKKPKRKLLFSALVSYVATRAW